MRKGDEIGDGDFAKISFSGSGNRFRESLSSVTYWESFGGGQAPAQNQGSHTGKTTGTAGGSE